MASKKSKPGASKPKVNAAVKKAAPAARGGQDKPPESAEDFEHVLRRLVATRDKLPHGT